jgi:hypothetical protein
VPVDPWPVDPWTADQDDRLTHMTSRVSIRFGRVKSITKTRSLLGFILPLPLLCLRVWPSDSCSSVNEEEIKLSVWCTSSTVDCRQQGCSGVACRRTILVPARLSQEMNHQPFPGEMESSSIIIITTIIHSFQLQRRKDLRPCRRTTKTQVDFGVRPGSRQLRQSEALHSLFAGLPILEQYPA